MPTACGSWRRDSRRVGKAEVEAEVVEEEDEEEVGGEGGGGEGGAGTAVIKSNNPHLAGGEINIKKTTKNNYKHLKTTISN